MGEDEGDLDQRLNAQLEAATRARENERQIRTTLMHILDGNAYERIMRVRMSNPETFARAVNAVVYVWRQRGKKITDEELVKLLGQLTERREGSIDIRRK